MEWGFDRPAGQGKVRPYCSERDTENENGGRHWWG